MLESGKKQTKEERIAHRAQRIAGKRVKPEHPALNHSQSLPVSHQHRDAHSSHVAALSHASDGSVQQSRASMLKHRQASTVPTAPAAQPSAASLMAAIQSQLHSQSLDSLDAVEAIQRTVEVKERERRERFEQERSKREAVITEERTASQQTAVTIKSHFTDIEVKAEERGPGLDAKSLYTDIASVYAETVALLQSKDALINELSSALTAVDKESVDCINEHVTNISTMIDELRKQSDQFESQCTASVSQLKQAYESDRKQLLQSHEQTLNLLYDKRKTMELTRLDTEINRENASSESLDSLRSRDDEDYYLLKQELETSIAQFSEQLEEMRNLYLFNAEKLNYHSHILFTRSASHRATIEHSRQMIRQWRETCSQVAAAAAKQEESLDKENELLRNEYITLTTKLKSLQEQWAFTQTRQSDLYHSIHGMHQQHCMQNTRKLLHAQQIIENQILGFPRHYKYEARFRSKQIEELDVSDIVETNSANSGTGSESTELVAVTNTSTVVAPIVPGQHTRHSRQQIHQLLQLLSEECLFLIDVNHVQRLQPIIVTDSKDNDSEENDSVWGVGDSILNACKIATSEQLDQFCALFYTDVNDTTLNIHPNDAIKTIKEFIEKRKNEISHRGGSGGAKGSDSVTSSKSDSASDKHFWHTFASVIDDNDESLWSTLDSYLGDYNGLLDRRAALISETGEMTRENEELKALLAQYQHASINEELLIPPTQLLTNITTVTSEKKANTSGSGTLKQTMRRRVK